MSSERIHSGHLVAPTTFGAAELTDITATRLLSDAPPLYSGYGKLDWWHWLYSCCGV